MTPGSEQDGRRSAENTAMVAKKPAGQPFHEAPMSDKRQEFR
ncbi:hypothetical protein [Streptomyces sp. CB03238]|nr:hypothetical protein [Streptomyces sp. CB03238]